MLGTLEKIFTANQKLVEATERQIPSQLRPYISIRAMTRPGSPIFQLSIANTGSTMAKNLRLTLSRDVYKFGTKDEKHHLNLSKLFRSRFQAFPPGSELIIDLGRSTDVSDAEDALCPSNFDVTAEYKGQEETYVEKTCIDLGMFGPSTLGNYGLTYEIREMTKTIGELKEAANAATGLLVEVAKPKLPNIRYQPSRPR